MTFLEIAGVPVSLEGSWGEVGGLLQQFAPYRVDRPSGAVVRVVLEGGRPAPDRSQGVVLERGSAWMAASLDGRSIRIGADSGEASIERLLMHGFASVLAVRGALLVHASAVVGPSGAIAFLGPSEAGKTTTARNCPARMLHPDRVAIGLDGGQPWLAPVPFLYGEPKSGSVRATLLDRLVFVHKATRNSVEPVPAADRVRRFLPSVLLPPDPFLAGRVLDTVELLSRLVPLLELRARREGGFWPLLTAKAATAIASCVEAD